jgi:AcrR family transcriptional regulator
VRAQRLPREARREQILDIALEMFAAEGFSGTSISEIERRVGFKAGTGSFYRHFASKEELLEAAVEREVGRCMEQIRREWSELDVPEDARLAMAATARQMLRNIRHFDRLGRLIQAEGDRVPGLRRQFIDALSRSHAFGRWVDDGAGFVAAAALLGFHQFHRASGGRLRGMSDDEFIDNLVALLPTPTVPERRLRRSR